MDKFGKIGLCVAVLLVATSLIVTCTTASVQTDVKAEVDNVCRRQQFGFGEPLDPKSSQDTSVKRRFERACKELLRQDGLDFGKGTTAYTCRVFLPRVTEKPSPEQLKKLETQYKDKNEFNELVAHEKRRIASYKSGLAALEAVLGRPLTMKSYNEDMQNPEDVMRQYRQQGKATQSLKGVPIGYSSTFAGLAVTLILLGNSDGTINRVLYSQDELDQALRGVATVAGAMDLISMRKLAGMENDMLLPGHHPLPLCHPGSVSEGPSGWTIRDVEVLPQCANSVLLDYRVLRTGETIPENLRSPLKPMRLCVD